MRAPSRHNSLASMSETLDEMFLFPRFVKLKDIRNRHFPSQPLRARSYDPRLILF
jgi:hypothetical protein